VFFELISESGISELYGLLSLDIPDLKRNAEMEKTNSFKWLRVIFWAWRVFLVLMLISVGVAVYQTPKEWGWIFILPLCLAFGFSLPIRITVWFEKRMGHTSIRQRE
jgi:hypothetical protein